MYLTALAFSTGNNVTIVRQRPRRQDFYSRATFHVHCVRAPTTDDMMYFWEKKREGEEGHECTGDL